MIIAMLCARVSASEITATVDYQGAKIEAKVPQVEVELTDESGQWGTVTLRFRSPEEREFCKKFVQGEPATIEI